MEADKQALIEALFFMCVQHCTTNSGTGNYEDDTFDYVNISSDETAFDVLGINDGEKVKTAMDRLGIKEWN